MIQREDPEACPQCQATEIIPIIYGMPGAGLLDEELEGKLKLGGCCISPESPNWHCKACGHEWLVEPGPYDSFDDDEEDEEIEVSAT